MFFHMDNNTATPAPTPPPDDKDLLWTPKKMAARYSYTSVKAFLAMAKDVRMPRIKVNARVIMFDIGKVKDWENKRAA